MDAEQVITLAENLTVKVMPDRKYEVLMTTDEVAKGYGVSGGTIRKHKLEHAEELVEGKHYISYTHYLPRVTKSNADSKSATYKIIYWTKRGIVRLGFFIKSDRARLFRDCVEDLVIYKTQEPAKPHQLALWPETPKRKHNRLTQERLVSILADVAKIEDKELRMSIVNKLLDIH